MLPSIEELSRGLGGGAKVRLDHIQREITSRAVNCLKMTPGTGRTSKVSTLDQIAGLGDRVLLGLRTA